MFNTIILLSILTALLAFMGFTFGGLFGATIALAFSLILNFAMYWKSDYIILRMYRAKLSNDYKLKEMIKELAKDAKIPEPKLYTIKTTHYMPNAFATGRDPKHAAIAVTESLLNLKNIEIKAVLAHEIAHIRNHDTLVNMLAATIGGAIAYLAQMGYWYMFFEGGNMRSNSQIMGIVLMVVFAPIAALMIRMSISRSMEYRADHTAALITKDPRSLAKALSSIHDAIKESKFKGSAATVNMWIANPLHRDKFTKLFSTHPPIEKRIKKLIEMEGERFE